MSSQGHTFLDMGSGDPAALMGQGSERLTGRRVGDKSYVSVPSQDVNIVEASKAGVLVLGFSGHCILVFVRVC